jgi:hypothetical protein
MKRAKTFELPHGFKWQRLGEGLWVIHFVNGDGSIAIEGNRLAWSTPNSVSEWDSATGKTTETKQKGVIKVFYVDEKLAWIGATGPNQRSIVYNGKPILLNQHERVNNIEGSMLSIICGKTQRIMVLDGDGIAPVAKDGKPVCFPDFGRMVNIDNQPFNYDYCTRKLHDTSGNCETSEFYPKRVSGKTLRGVLCSDGPDIVTKLYFGEETVFLPRTWELVDALEKLGTLYCLCNRRTSFSVSEVSVFCLADTGQTSALVAAHIRIRDIIGIVMSYVEMTELWDPESRLSSIPASVRLSSSAIWAWTPRTGREWTVRKFSLMTGELLARGIDQTRGIPVGLVNNTPVVCDWEVAKVSLVFPSPELGRLRETFLDSLYRF